jgi:hypothetical protein
LNLRTKHVFLASWTCAGCATSERAIPISYKGAIVDCGYRLDLVVDDRILLELKTVERLLPIHQAQVITYLKLSGLGAALLVNFNSRVLREGIRRLWLSDKTFLPSPLPVPPKTIRLTTMAIGGAVLQAPRGRCDECSAVRRRGR